MVAEKSGRREEKREGMIIDICRLAPVAIMGADDRYRTIRIDTSEDIGGAYGSLLDGPNRLYVRENFQPLAEKLKQALEEFDIELLEAENLNQPLPFQERIPTIYREPGHYLFMDAIFYWED